MCDYVIVCVHIKCASSFLFNSTLYCQSVSHPAYTHAVVRSSCSLIIINSQNLTVVRTTTWWQLVRYGSNKLNLQLKMPELLILDFKQPTQVENVLWTKLYIPGCFRTSHRDWMKWDKSACCSNASGRKQMIDVIKVDDRKKFEAVFAKFDDMASFKLGRT